jgi:hypothetical protein
VSLLSAEGLLARGEETSQHPGAAALDRLLESRNVGDVDACALDGAHGANPLFAIASLASLDTRGRCYGVEHVESS